jgi:hypothetical protein
MRETGNPDSSGQAVKREMVIAQLGCKQLPGGRNIRQAPLTIHHAKLCAGRR